MKLIRGLALGAIAAIAAGAPARSSAQLAQKFVLTPYAGVYVPSADVIKVSLADAGTSFNAYAKHQSTIALGTTASYWFTDRVAVEGGLVYAGSDLKSGGLLNENGILTPGSATDHANVWLGSAKVLFQLLPPESGYNLRLGFGPAVITRNGTAYKDQPDGKFTGLTDFGAVASLCTRVPLSDIFSLRLRAEDYIYQTKLGFNSNVSSNESFKFDARKQSDLVFSVGLQMFLNK